MKKIIVVLLGITTYAVPSVSRNTQNAMSAQDFIDVGVLSVGMPQYILPGHTSDVEVTYKNFGDSTETFLAGVSIDSSGVNVYSQSIDIMLGPGLDSTVV